MPTEIFNTINHGLMQTNKQKTESVCSLILSVNFILLQFLVDKLINFLLFFYIKKMFITFFNYCMYTI